MQNSRASARRGASIASTRSLARPAVRDGVIACITFALLVAAFFWNSEPSPSPSPPPPAMSQATVGMAALALTPRPDAAVLGRAVSAAVAPQPYPNRAFGLLERTSQNTALFILAGAFSAIIIFNLWFLRHLRRVYASPRRGAWRRG